MGRYFRMIGTDLLRYVVLALVIIACYQVYLLNYHSYVWSHLKEKVNTNSFPEKHNIHSHPRRRSGDRIRNGENALSGGKPVVTLAVGILSQLRAIDRREAIRSTWFKVCDENPDQVVCRFFTDPILNNTDKLILEEKRNYTDIEYMPIKSGYNFALRLVWMLQYFTDRYEYDFFLRIDDDYFLCLDRLLYELPYRPLNGLYWGYIHCQPHIVRVDEGFMILTRDIILEALGKLNTTLQCHSFGDQAVALWLQDSNLNITYFSDNSRVIHEVTSYRGSKYLLPNICEHYLGLHGTYSEYMHLYWELSEGYKDNMLFVQYRIPKIRDFYKVCPFSKEFDYRYFVNPFYDMPVLCKYNPIFRETTEPYGGRQAETTPPPPTVNFFEDYDD